MKSGFTKELEPRLIDKAKILDKDALKTIYITYCDAVYNLAFRITGDRDVAQDVMQETFIKVIDKITTYNGSGVFSGWIKRITVNQAIAKLRYDYRFEDDCISDKDELISTNLFNTNWVNAATDLSKMLLKLNDDMRAVFWLHEVEGFDHKEIAQYFGKSESFSKVNLMRAYRKLKQLAETADGGKSKCI